MVILVFVLAPMFFFELVDTYFHASRAPGHNMTKAHAFPTSGKKEGVLIGGLPILTSSTTTYC